MNVIFSRIISLAAAIILAIPNFFTGAVKELDAKLAEQLEHYTQLEELYADSNYVAVDDAKFAPQGLLEAVEGGIKYNEMRFLSTHNSYKADMNNSFKWIKNNLLDPLGIDWLDKFRLSYEPLSEQLNNGVRSLELDVITKWSGTERSFVCCHIPYFDMNSNCFDFELALKEVKLWSDNNPGHMPISIIVEPKLSTTPYQGLPIFTLSAANQLDGIVSEIFGTSLFTPSDFLRDYDSFTEMRAADDWPTVKSMCGKVVVMLHDNAVTNQYAEQDTTLRSQSMLPMVDDNNADSEYASVVVQNSPKKVELNKSFVEAGLIVRTRLDTNLVYDEERFSCGLESGAQILTTDFPPRTLENGDEYVAYLKGNFTILF